MNFKEIADALNGNTRRRANTRFAVGTTIGVLLGAAAGIMLAPKSGRELRKDIKHGAEVGVVKARETALKAAKYVKKEVSSVNDTVADKVNDLKTNLKHAKEAAKDSEKAVDENKS